MYYKKMNKFRIMIRNMLDFFFGSIFLTLLLFFGFSAIMANSPAAAAVPDMVKNNIQPISIEEIGGPAATPTKCMLLYKELIVPLCSFSIPSVIKASKHGKNIPIPKKAKLV